MTHGTTHKLLDAYPKDLGSIDTHKLAECISACFDCAQACTACADACLSEDMVAELTKCIRTDLDCADICTTTGNILSRHTGYDANVTRAVLQACATVCRAGSGQPSEVSSSLQACSQRRHASAQIRQ